MKVSISVFSSVLPSIFPRLCSGVLVAAALCVPSLALAEDSQRASFCHGYIKKALGELPIEELDRGNMWLAWHETVQTALIADKLDKTQYQRGRDRFSSQLAAGDVSAMEDVVEGECELGKNRTWRWW